MKKLFLTSGLILCMACPAFAVQNGVIEGEVANSSADECVQSVLGVDSGSATLEAIWNADSYNVIYAPGLHGTGGATYTGGVTYDQNYTVLAPANIMNGQVAAPVVANTGYTFAGWNDGTADRAVGYTYSPYRTVGDLTLTAQWTANQHQITYATGTAGARTTGFSGTMAATPTTYDASVTLSDNAFSIPGYQFNGWTSPTNLASGATASTSYNDGATVNPYKVDADVELTATWTPLTYNVIYNPGAHSASNAYTDTNGATYDANYTALTQNATGIVAADGYTFVGWNTATGQTAANWTGETPWTHTDALTVYAAYTANPYTITYNCGGPVQGSQSTTTGPTTASSSVNMDGAFTLAAADNCSLPGYTFAGWSCPNLTGTPTLPAGDPAYFAGGAEGTYRYAGDVTCTAQWTQNDITLNWNANGADNAAAVATSVTSAGAGTCTYDEGITLPTTDPAKTGYTFGGWEVQTQSQNP